MIINPSYNKTKIIYTILFLALFVRILWILVYNPTPTSDANRFFELASSIANGEGYTLEGVKTAYRPIGFPGFVGIIFSIFGINIRTVQFINVILSVLSLFIFYKLIIRHYNQYNVAILTTILLAVDINLMGYNSLLMSEPLYIFVILAALYSMSVNRSIFYTVLSGVFWGAAILIKPQTVFIPIVFYISKFILKDFNSSSFKKLLLMYFVIIITITPWIIRNYQVFNKFIFISTSGGTNLLIGNGEYADGSCNNVNGKLSNMKKIIVDGNEIKITDKCKKEAIQYIKDHPIRTISLIPLKIYHLFKRNSDGISANYRGIKQTHNKLKLYLLAGLKRLQNAYYYLLLIFSIFGIYSVLKNKNKYYLFLGIILYFILLQIVFYGSPRYKLPIIPFIYFFSAVGIVKMVSVYKNKKVN